MVKIRMQRGGRTHKPIYTIVAANSREPRDGKFLEKLGQYDPNAETVLKDVNVDGIKAWVAKGAQLSDTVSSLLKKQGVKL
ncbi:MAG: 30S ribosomal protein S16 [Bdellovibrionota bacterium]|nr:30S ribosomal protein S16 [Bdellovibrionota bacterium]